MLKEERAGSEIDSPITPEIGSKYTKVNMIMRYTQRQYISRRFQRAILLLLLLSDAV